MSSVRDTGVAASVACRGVKGTGGHGGGPSLVNSLATEHICDVAEYINQRLVPRQPRGP